MAWIDKLRRLFRRDFPEPKAHNLPLEQLFRFYHKKLNDQQRNECKILVYRMDPAKAPYPALVKFDVLTRAVDIFVRSVGGSLLPPIEWWASSDMPQQWKAVFCVRIQRSWKTEYGTKTKEICIATFEMTVAGAESMAAALPETLSAQGKDGPTT